MTEKKKNIKQNQQREDAHGKIPEESRHEFPTPLLRDSHGVHLIPQQQVVTICDMSSTRVLLGTGHMGSPIPGTDQNSRLPDGKKVFSIKKKPKTKKKNHCWYNKAPPLHEGMAGPPEMQVPRAQPCSHAFPSKDSSLGPERWLFSAACDSKF